MYGIISELLEAVTQNYDRSQPWLQERSVEARIGKYSGTIVRTAKFDKNAVRNAGIADIGECEKSLLFSMLGISYFQLAPGEQRYRGSGGESLNQDLNRILRENPEEWIIGDDFPAGVVDGKPYEKLGAVSLRLGSGQKWSKNDGGVRQSFFGVFDFQHLPEGQIVELKTIWGDEELPEAPSQRALKQVSIYITEKRAPGGWLLYLPADLSTVDPDDDTTFRAFYVDAEEAREVYGEAMTMIEDVIMRLSWGGSAAYPKHSAKWLYRIVQSIPDCDQEGCCERARAFHSSISVGERWTFTAKR